MCVPFDSTSAFTLDVSTCEVPRVVIYGIFLIITKTFKNAQQDNIRATQELYYTKLHRVTQNYSKLHQVTSSYTKLHQVTASYTKLHVIYTYVGIILSSNLLLLWIWVFS